MQHIQYGTQQHPPPRTFSSPCISVSVNQPTLGPWNSTDLVSKPLLLLFTMQSFIISLSRLNTFHGSSFTASWITWKCLTCISRVTMCLSLGQSQLMAASHMYLSIVPLSLAQMTPSGWNTACPLPTKPHSPDSVLASPHLAHHLPGTGNISPFPSFPIVCNSMTMVSFTVPRHLARPPAGI